MITRDEPDLAKRLASTTDVTAEDRDEVSRILVEEFSTQVHGPDWEPTEYGKKVDEALGQFYRRFPAGS